MNSTADPRITAYALGELTGPEREAFERELATSTALQHAMKETLAVAEAIRALPSEEDTLPEEQRAALLARCAANLEAEARQRAIRRRVGVLGITALAASITVATILSLPRKTATPVPTAPLAVNAPPPPTPAEQLPAARPAGTPVLLAGADGYVQGHDTGSLVARQQEAPLSDSERSDLVGGGRKAEDKESADISTHARLLAQTKGPAPQTATVAAVDAIAPASAPAAALVPAQSLAKVKQSPEQTGPKSETFFGSPMAGATADLATAPRGAETAGWSGAVDEVRAFRHPEPFDAAIRPPAESHAETYAPITGNTFQAVTAAPLSTFSIDVDTASYSNVRRFLVSGQQPPTDAVRLEELINYFPYNLPQPKDSAPFSITTEVSHAPWNERHLLARIALKGRDVAVDKLPPSNLVFLVDVSGSMKADDKLPLLKRSLRELVQRLTPRDRVAIAVYAGSSGLALPSTSGEDQSRILAAIDRLEAGGSTNGASGIRLAYETARENFLKEGNNRVILCTDGDFNVGVTSHHELTRLIERERKSGVFLSVLGFGTGNLKDATMENLADKGNGNYAYIDSPAEGRKVLVEQMGATLFTIAKDVKIQVEFNPATVAGYRLIGYENRLLAKEDFNDDTKDAGEIGAGHTVTALYEIVPAGQPLPNDRTVDPLKYQPVEPSESDNPKSEIQNPKSRDLFTVKLRYKAPDGDTSKLIEKVVGPEAGAFDRASEDLRFASAVAAFGMKLRGDANDTSMDWNAIQKIARASLGEDPGAYRAEFLTLIEKARHLRDFDDE
jgi:secreted protein with Ig-like and vWFA domain